MKKKALLVLVALIVVLASISGLIACVGDNGGGNGGGNGSGNGGDVPDEKPAATYTVTFMADGVTVGTATYTEDNKDITEPEVPKKDGYTGAWEEYNLSKGDITVNAVYTANEYTVTFKADGLIVATVTYTENNKDITEPEVPKKDGYKGVWEDYKLTTGDKTVNAVYTVIVTEGLEYKLINKSYFVEGYTGTDTEIIIPSTHEGYPVTRIGVSAFKDCVDIVSVKIPDSVTIIDQDAFSGCSGLKNIEIPNGVTNIYAGAFYGCSNLTNIEIPDSVTSIGLSAFNGCSSLKSITIPYVGATSDESSNNHFGYIFGASDVNDNGDYVPNSLRKVIITGGKIIGRRAFDGCSNLTSIKIPDGVTSIGDWAFDQCRSLKDFSIGSGLQSIGKKAFQSCSWLSSIEIPSSVSYIGEEAFWGCGKIKISCEAESKPLDWENNWNINNYPVIWDYKNNDVAEDGNIYYTENGILYALKNEEATVAKQDPNIEGVITIPSTIAYKGKNYSVTNIGNSAFSSCSKLESIEIPEGVTSIGYWAFADCSSLVSIEIPNSVTSIDHNAFRDCSSLTSIKIPASVLTIGENAFIGNIALIISCEAKSKPSGWDSDWNYISYEVYCPVIWDYKNNDEVDDGNIYVAENGIRYEIKEGKAIVIGQSTSLSGALEIPSIITCKGKDYEVTSIGDSAFSDCSSIVSIKIPVSVTSIGSEAFYNCSSIESIEIPEGVTSIGSYAFSGCSSLASIELPNSVTSIGMYAFSECSSLVSIKIPNRVTTIEVGVFEDCISLTNIEIPNSVTTIDNGAFSDCSSLTSVVIPNSVIKIGNRAFGYCSSLVSIVIPKSVKSIGYGVFEDCISLTLIEYSGTKAEWKAIEKENDWNKNTGEYTVTCSDETLTKAESSKK